MTLWLSMIATLGLASRPVRSQSVTTGAWFIRSNTASSHRQASKRYTVGLDRESFGNSRHVIPPRRTWNMAVTISRFGNSGRPVELASGENAAINRHSASLKSARYRFATRVCCTLVAGVHMLVSERFANSRNYMNLSRSTPFGTVSKPPPGSGDGRTQSHSVTRSLLDGRTNCRESLAAPDARGGCAPPEVPRTFPN